MAERSVGRERLIPDGLMSCRYRTNGDLSDQEDVGVGCCCELQPISQCVNIVLANLRHETVAFCHLKELRLSNGES
jgi:hypothetical protein